MQPINIQSFIDVITNSSTSVFTWADNIDGVKRIINGVLKAANSDYICDDLFDITTEWEDNALSDYLDYQIDEAKEHIDESSELKELFTLWQEEYNKPPYEQRSWYIINKVEDKIVNIVSKNKEEWNIKSLDEWVESRNEYREYKYSSSYVITPKDPGNEEAAKMVEAINGLFNYDASYC